MDDIKNSQLDTPINQSGLVGKYPPFGKKFAS